MMIKPGLHISRKDRKHLFANIFFKAIQIWLGLHIVEMITSIDVSQEIVATDILKALRSSCMFCDCYNYMETRLNTLSTGFLFHQIFIVVL